MTKRRRFQHKIIYLGLLCLGLLPLFAGCSPPAEDPRSIMKFNTGPIQGILGRDSTAPPEYHYPTRWWAANHMVFLSRPFGANQRFFRQKDCLVCHRPADSCNICHDYVGAKPIINQAL